MLGVLWKPFGHLLGIGENVTDPKKFNQKQISRLLYRVEAAMHYVHVDEKSGEFEGIKESVRRKKKIHYRKRIFDAS